MATFDVYVEGPVKPGPDSVEKLATIMSQRYGLAAGELIARLNKGRFRVKGNLDEATANTYARDLEKIGARVTLAESKPSGASVPQRQISVSLPTVSQNVVQRPTPVPNRTSTPTPAVPEKPVARPSPLPEKAKPVEAKPVDKPADKPADKTDTQYSRTMSNIDLPLPSGKRSIIPAPASGLSAAFSNDAAPIEGLGALDSEAIALATLDGQDDAGKPAISFAPPKPGAAKPAAKKKPADVPLDMFAPPDAGAGEMSFEIAVDEVDARKQQKTPPPVQAVQTSSQAIPELALAIDSPKAKSQPIALGSQSASSQPLRVKADTKPRGEPVVMATVAEDNPRWRFAAGILVSIVLGFIPAHLVASSREASADKVIDADVIAKQEVSTSLEEYAKLDDFRDDEIAKKKSAHRNIALVSMLIWAGAGAAIAFAWFRLVPWDRLRGGGLPAGDDQSSSS